MAFPLTCSSDHACRFGFCPQPRSSSISKPSAHVLKALGLAASGPLRCEQAIDELCTVDPESNSPGQAVRCLMPVEFAAAYLVHPSFEPMEDLEVTVRTA